EVVPLCFEAAMDGPVPTHLYEVTSGLRSLVLGEAEIAGQVRQAFETARRAGRTTSMLHDLFQHGFRCAKSVATQTPVASAGPGGPSGRSARIGGGGAYARLGLAALVRGRVKDIHVCAPSGRAAGCAGRHGVGMVGPTELEAGLRETDRVLACSGRGTSLFP